MGSLRDKYAGYPESYKNLKYKNKLFVDCYLGCGVIEPYTHRDTFSDEFVSFIFAYDKGKECSEAFKLRYYTVDQFGGIHELKNYKSGCKTEIVVLNAAKYMSLCKVAKKVKYECQHAINDLRIMMYTSEDKSKEMELRDAIFQSSMRGEDAKDRNDNRKMAMKMFGLDQIKVDGSIDIYQASGKQILGRLGKVVENSDMDDAPIIPISLEQAVSDGESESKKE